jgi:hypothetical protein
MLFISIWVRRFDGVVVLLGFGFFYFFELDVFHDDGCSDSVCLPIPDQVDPFLQAGITDKFLAGGSFCGVARFR